MYIEIIFLDHVFLHNEVDNVYCMGEHWDLYACMSYSVRRVFIDVITETVSYV